MPPPAPSVLPRFEAIKAPVPARDRRVLLFTLLIAVATLLAYSNSFQAPFIFDDIESIQRNPTLRNFSTALAPPADSGLANRPLASLTFALNYAWSGERVESYHAINLLIHLLAALTLFGVVQRILLSHRFPPLVRNASVPLAFFTALLWALHPVQTESVTYLSQRTEALMGLFYLLTVYTFLRSASSRFPVRWQALSVVACILGTWSKEVIATAPLIVLLCDRTFVVNTFREAWRMRSRYYLILSTTTWLILGFFMIHADHGNVGLGYGVSAWSYALTSCRSIIIYLGLSIWPHRLIFDYGLDVVERAAEVWPYIIALVLLVTATSVALWRRLPIGWAGAWFLGILAPVSSVIPILGQPTAEHRVYLSSAAVMALLVVGLYTWAGKRSFFLSGMCALVFGGLTFVRNRDYASALMIWKDTVVKCPSNFRAHNNVGNELVDQPGRLAEAIAAFDAALRLKPDYADALINRGNALIRIPGRLEDARVDLEWALQIKPESPEAHNNLANVLLQVPGRMGDAIGEYRKAIQLSPDFAEAQNNLADALAAQPNGEAEAIAAYRRFLELEPLSWKTHYKLGNLLAKSQAPTDEIITAYQTALRFKPDYAEAHFSLGSLLSDLPGRWSEAVEHLQAAVRFNPEFADAYLNLGTALAMMPGRLPDAAIAFERALQLNPALVDAHFNLGNALLNLPGREPEAAPHFEAALRLRPDDADIHFILGQLLVAQPSRWADGMAHLEESIRLCPELTPAKELLAQLRRTAP